MRNTFFVLILVFLSGCAGLGQVESASSLSFDQVIAVEEIKFLDSPGELNIVSLGQIKGLSCKKQIFSPTPTEEDARAQLKIKAVKLYADAILYPTCSKTKGVDMSNNCFASWICTGEAVVINDNFKDDGSSAPVEFVGMAAEEIASKNYDEKLWARSLALASWDEERRKGIYINLRSKHLYDERRLKEEKIANSVDGSITEVDISGTYRSKITGTYQATDAVEIEQSGNKVTGISANKKWEFEGVLEGNVIKFKWYGLANKGKGKFTVDSRGYLIGVYTGDSWGEGKWILIKSQ